MIRSTLVAGVGGLLTGAALRPVTRGDAPATTLVLGALILCVLAPWLAARGPEAEAEEGAHPPRPLPALVACLAAIVGLGLAGPAAFGPGLLGGMAYLALWALTLIGVTCSLGRAGQPVATALGLLVLAFPYYAELVRALFAVSDRRAMALVLYSPLSTLTGTFGAVDVLRQGALYDRFPLGQSFPYSYPAPWAACFVLGQLTAAAWARPLLPRLWAWLRRRRSEGGASPLLPAAVLLFLLVGAPGEARAQLFPQPTAPAQGAGDLVTRVRLGYWVTRLRGELQLKGHQEPALGSTFDYDRHLDLNPVFVVPTFEVELSWENSGRVWLQYIEERWQGERQTHRDFVYKDQRFFGGNQQEAKLTYRTIALGGAFDVPIAEWISGYVLTTQRYVYHQSKLRGFPQGYSVTDSMEAFVPTIGVGAQVLIWNVISAYGDIQWIDFRTKVLGTEDNRYAFKYREFRFGIRLSLVEHAHILVEYYHLDTEIKRGRERYATQMLGVRVQVSILF